MVKSLGADLVVDYTKKDFTRMNQTFDVVFDTIGKSSYSKCKRILSEKGQYVSPVLKLSVLSQMGWTSVFSSRKAKFAATGLRSEAELTQLFAQLLEIYNEGHLMVVIDRQFPLDKVAEAHRYIALGHKKGNVIIVVEPENE